MLHPRAATSGFVPVQCPSRPPLIVIPSFLMLCSIAFPALGICPIVGWWTLGSKQLSIDKTSTRACCRRTASYSETQTQRIYEPPRRLFTWSLTEVRRRSAVYNRSLVHGPLQLSIDDSAYDSKKLHGYTLHELIGFLGAVSAGRHKTGVFSPPGFGGPRGPQITELGAIRRRRFRKLPPSVPVHRSHGLG